MSDRLLTTRAIACVARAAGVLQIDLARKCCMTGDRISDILTGRRKASPVELETLCGAMGGSPESVRQAFGEIQSSLARMRGE